VSKYDVVFIGSSPNALAGAARLARSGKQVLVLEPRDGVGGPVATAEFAPGFRADTALSSVVLDPEIAADLGVELDVVRRDTVTLLGPEPVTVRAPALPQAVTDAVGLLRAMARMAPPAMPATAAGDAAALGEIADRLLGLGERGMHEVLRLLFLPARDFARETALPEAERTVLCAGAVRAVSEGPFAPGTLHNYLSREAAGDGLFGPTVRGGLGRIAEVLAEKARMEGAEIRTGTGPLAVDVQAGAARGVIAGDERIEAGAVVSDLDVRATFTRLVPAYEVPPEINRAIRALRYRGSVARVHLALRGLPAFNDVGAAALGGALVLAPGVDFLERAWDQAKRGAVPERPYIEVTVPSAADPGLAPEGSHVLSAWIQWVPYRRADREALLRTVVDRLAAFAPGLPDQVLHHDVLLPEDLEDRFGLTEGHLYGGETSLAQAFFLRGVPGHAHHTTPIEGLYLCGSAIHPGGYSGRSGWSLAGLLLS
jgi:phytoene dehydrogenase-like protein